MYTNICVSKLFKRTITGRDLESAFVLLSGMFLYACRSCSKRIVVRSGYAQEIVFLDQAAPLAQLDAASQVRFELVDAHTRRKSREAPYIRASWKRSEGNHMRIEAFEDPAVQVVDAFNASRHFPFLCIVRFDTRPAL